MDRQDVFLVEDEVIPPEDLDIEDIEDIMYDCHALLSRVLDRQNPQWLANDGAKLLERLEEALSWYRIH